MKNTEMETLLRSEAERLLRELNARLSAEFEQPTLFVEELSVVEIQWN